MSPYFNDLRSAFHFYLINLFNKLNSHENRDNEVLNTKLKLFPMKISF